MKKGSSSSRMAYGEIPLILKGGDPSACLRVNYHKRYFQVDAVDEQGRRAIAP